MTGAWRLYPKRVDARARYASRRVVTQSIGTCAHPSSVFIGGMQDLPGGTGFLDRKVSII
jgi:hypothetical protein